MGGIALAVELLAHAAHGERDLQDLAVRWHTERVRLLQRASADHRLLSIAVSLDTSWNSPLMTAPARRLLSLLGRLPDGIAIDHVAALLADEGAAAANTLRRRGLVIDDHPRLRTLPPLRHHLAYAHPPQDDDWQRATGHYCSLAETLADRAGRRGGNEALTALAKDSANITIALIDILTGPQPSTAYTAAQKLIGAASSNGADVSRVADALLAAAERARVLADNLLMLGMLDLVRSNHNAGRSAYERAQSLLEDVGDMRRLASCIQRLGDIALFEFDHDAARSAYQRAIALHAQTGEVAGQADCIQGLGHLALERSDHDAARSAYQQAHALHEQAGNVSGQADCIQGLGHLALERSDHDAGRSAYQRAHALHEQVGDVLGQANCIQFLAAIAATDSDHDAARNAVQRAQALLEEVGDVRALADCIQLLGHLALRRSDHDAARSAYQRAHALHEQVSDVLGQANCITCLGDIALQRSDREAARSAYQQALRLYATIPQPYSLGATHRRLARIAPDHSQRCEHVNGARSAWAAIQSDDLLAELKREFEDCT